GEDGHGRLRATSDANGHFQLAVFPGPGRLVVKGPSPDYLHVETTSGELAGNNMPSNGRVYPDALLALNYKPGAEPADITVNLRKGITVKGAVLKPDGQPSTACKFVSRSYIPEGFYFSKGTLSVQDGHFELPGCDPRKSRPVYFFDAKNKLGVAVTVSGE